MKCWDTPWQGRVFRQDAAHSDTVVHQIQKALEKTVCSSKRVNVGRLGFLSVLIPPKTVFENSTKIRLSFVEFFKVCSKKLSFGRGFGGINSLRVHFSIPPNNTVRCAKFDLITLHLLSSTTDWCDVTFCTSDSVLRRYRFVHLRKEIWLTRKGPEEVIH